MTTYGYDNLNRRTRVTDPSILGYVTDRSPAKTTRPPRIAIASTNWSSMHGEARRLTSNSRTGDEDGPERQRL